MIFSLPFESASIDDLKVKLGIPRDNAHRLEVGLWYYGHNRKLVIDCKVSVFTSANHCIQGQGANFSDAKEEIILKLKPKSRVLEPQEEVRVITEE